MSTHSSLTVSNAWGIFVKNILLFTQMKQKTIQKLAP